MYRGVEFYNPFSISVRLRGCTVPIAGEVTGGGSICSTKLPHLNLMALIMALTYIDPKPLLGQLPFIYTLDVVFFHRMVSDSHS